MIGQVSRQSQLGTLRVLTTKFIEYRKKHIDEAHHAEKLLDTTSSLNDTGKTRYTYRFIISLLGKAKNGQIELSSTLR